jgi:membrane protease YdiL (CAAX protease family)
MLGANFDGVAIGAILSAIAFPVSIWIAARLLDRRPFTDFGFHFSPSWWRQFLFGLLLGAGLMTAIFIAELLLGWITITDTFYVVEPNSSFALAYLLPIIVFLCVGFYEELWSRGYQLTNVAEGFNFRPIGHRLATLIALVLTSAVFGFLHASNPNATFISSFNIAVAGIFLGLGFVLTGELAIPIGLHMTWNFFQGNVFGFPVSGTATIGATIFRVEQGGADLLTGGAFGPEAGAIGLVAIGIGCVLTWLFVGWEKGSAAIEPSIAAYRPNRVVREVDFS